MSKKKGGPNFFYTTVMPKIYGIGASVVIIGALFKIMHWPMAGFFLVVGLTTEAIIFFFSAFEPSHFEPDWTKVYPELADEAPKRRVEKKAGGSVTKKLDHMLESAKIGPELINSLGKGMKGLSDSVSQMSTISNAAVATNEYAKNVQTASKSLVDMNKSYSSTVSAMSEMANASKDAKAYHDQVVAVTKNLSSLNSVYEMELKDANSHLKALNKFYSSMAAAMENVTEAGKGTEQFKGELSKLTGNLTNLNKVYGNMLAAMKG